MMKKKIFKTKVRDYLDYVNDRGFGDNKEFI
jgi:hypothetical protein